VICNDLETLFWLAQMANLELHTWYSRTNPAPVAPGLPPTFSGSLHALEAAVLNYR
jgi:DNA primase